MPSSGGYESGTFVRYRIKIVEGTISGRKRSITVSVEYWRTNTGYTTYGSGTCYCTINGTTYSQAITAYQDVTYNSYTEMFTKTVDVTYDDYGNASLSVSAYSSANVDNLTSGPNGGTIDLSNIGAVKYAVKYEANGGTGAPSNQYKVHGTTLILSDTKPTRAGYNFLGWATSSGATSATYTAGSNYTSNAALTLYAVWQIAYIKPRITSFSVYRSDSSGSASDIGTYFKINFKWATDKDVSSITIKWKPTSASSWTNTTTISASGTSGTVSSILGGGELSTESSYSVTAVVADSGGESSAVGVVSGQVFPIDFLAGGTGVAFGKPAETANIVDSNWPIYQKGSIVLTESTGYKLSGGISIPENSDLNSDTYKVIGNYYCNKNATVATLSNSPTTNAFTMKIYYATGTGYVAQRIIDYHTGQIYHRYFSEEWRDWNTIGQTNIDIDDYIGDYVVSRGTTGIWTYEKWNSGKAVCWGKNNFGTIACTSAWGNIYTSSAMSINLPSGLFTENPQSVTIDLLYAGTYDAWINRGSVALSTSSVGGICLSRAKSASCGNVTLGFHVIGKWK